MITHGIATIGIEEVEDLFEDGIGRGKGELGGDAVGVDDGLALGVKGVGVQDFVAGADVVGLGEEEVVAAVGADEAAEDATARGFVEGDGGSNEGHGQLLSWWL